MTANECKLHGKLAKPLDIVLKTMYCNWERINKRFMF